MRYPDVLWLLLILPVIAALMYRGFLQGRKEFKRLKGNATAERVYDLFTIKWFFSSFFFLLTLALGIVSLAGVTGQRGTPETVPAELDVIFAVDVSRSMWTEDVAPSRLGYTSSAVRSISGALTGARAGMVVFKGDAAVLVPVTEDRTVFDAAAQYLSPAAISAAGTNLERCVRTAVRAFPGNEERRRRVLLFSDGENHSGDIQRAVEFAQSRDVQVHTIGVGTASGGPIPLPEGGFLEDAAGQRVVSRLEPSVLEQIADGTGGKYMAVENFDSVNEIVSALELQQQGDRIRFIQDGRYRIFLLLAIIFLFASIAVKVIPWKGTF
jgi:Ca-activated chloride channel family protein